MNCAVISDSYIISHLITSTLKPYGYECERVRIKNLKIRDLNIKRFSIIIISTSQDQVLGIDIAKKIRDLYSDVVIMAITTKGDWKAKIQYLENGADDVINYPFPMQELSARVKNLLSRPKEKVPSRYSVRGAVIDTDLKAIYLNDKPLDLRRKEFGIIEYLAQNSNRTVTRSELIDNIWDYRKVTSSNTVDVHVSNIRKRFGDRNIIKTVHGFGYKINDECKKEKL